MNLRVLQTLLLVTLGPAFAASARVVVNEIFYHAPDDLSELEWIEIHNADARAVDLSGWRLTQGIEFRFPDNTTLGPGAYLVVCRERKIFAEYYELPVVGEFKGSLGDGGDTVTLVDHAGSPVDRVTYQDDAPWPVAADGIAASLERITPDAPGDSAANWTSSPLPEDGERPAGTPGARNVGFSAVPPPIIGSPKVAPESPRPGQPIRVEATVEDSGGIATVQLLYRIARPGSVGDEQSVPMTTQGGPRYSGEIPGVEAGRLVRLRVRATNLQGAVRLFPSAHDLRPAISLFVQDTPPPAHVGLADVVATDPKEFATLERLRKRSLQPARMPMADEDSQRLLAMLGAGLNLPEAWFEVSVRQSLEPEALRQVRRAFLSSHRERESILETALSTEDPGAQIKTLPPVIDRFRTTFLEQVRSALPPEPASRFESWYRKQGGKPEEGPEGFLQRFMDIEGAWLAVNMTAELSADALARLRPVLLATATGRSESGQKLMRGELDFEKFQATMGKLQRTLANEYDTVLEIRPKRALAAWRAAQGSPIRPRSGVVKPRPPRGNTAFVVTDTQKGTTQVFDFLHVTERSAGYRIRFHKDQTWNGMTGCAVIFEYDDRFVLAEPLAFELYRRAGNAACLTDFVRLSIHGQTLGYHLVVEPINAAFLRRNRLDPDGDLYNILWYGNGIEGQHEKQNHPDHDHGALRELVQALGASSGEAQSELIRRHFDVPQVATYFAVNAVLSHWDGFFNNYFAYQAPKPDGRWRMFPWDQDKTWGFHDASGDQVFFDMPLSFGMNGDRPPGGGEPRFDPGHWWRPGGYFSGPLLANPEFRKRFLLRTREILEDVYTEKIFFPIIEGLAERLKPEVEIRAKALGEDPAQALARLARNVASLEEHLVKRRKFLLEQAEIRALPR